MKLTKYQMEWVYKTIITYRLFAYIDDKCNLIIKRNGLNPATLDRKTDKWRMATGKEINIVNKQYLKYNE